MILQRLIHFQGLLAQGVFKRDWKVLVQLYKVLVSPHLQYFVPFWSPMFKKKNSDSNKQKEVQLERLGEQRMETLIYTRRVKQRDKMINMRYDYFYKIHLQVTLWEGDELFKE